MRCLPKQEVDPIFLRSLGMFFLGATGGTGGTVYKGRQKKNIVWIFAFLSQNFYSSAELWEGVYTSAYNNLHFIIVFGTLIFIFFAFRVQKREKKKLKNTYFVVGVSFCFLNLFKNSVFLSGSQENQ